MKFKPKPRGASLYIFLGHYGSLFGFAFLAMVLVGVLHSIHPDVPTVDYWSTVIVLAIARGVYDFVTTDYRKVALEELED